MPTIFEGEWRARPLRSMRGAGAAMDIGGSGMDAGDLWGFSLGSSSEDADAGGDADVPRGAGPGCAGGRVLEEEEVRGAY